jgi:5-methylcytosine-specific restriction enzyme A
MPDCKLECPSWVTSCLEDGVPATDGLPSATDAGQARIRKHQLLEHPLCRFCAERGLVVPATICDHVEPHHGDANRFWLGPLQSLCENCHNSAKKLIEQRGYRPDIGLDGWPLDPRHPVYRAR